MAEEETRTSLTMLLRQFDGPSFWRLAKWGVAAFAAVTLALFVGTSDLGLRRIAHAFAAIQGMPSATAVVPRDNNEVMRLTDQLRMMTSEQNRLYARLEKLERNFNDLTGSIAQSARPQQAPEIGPPPPAETGMPPQTVPSSVAPPSVAPPSNVVVQQPPVAAPTQETTPPDASAATKPDFGIDLGSAPNVEALRSLWISAKSKHATVLEGLRPIVTIRENTRPGSVELRLVAGPIPSAALAARMCVVIIATGSVCQPAVFDGQRLAMR